MTTLSVKSALLKTATIEIQALSVNARQMTLAVFRQLDYKDLIDLEADLPRLNGMPWGRVNYHPDKCNDGDEHLHIVWQRDHFLYRAKVHLLVGHPDSLSWEMLCWHSQELGEIEKALSYRKTWESLRALNNRWASYQEYLDHYNAGDLKREPAKMHKLVTECDSKQISAQLVTARKERDDYVKAYVGIYRDLEALDLLFIAL